jgi:hypothetical protein
MARRIRESLSSPGLLVGVLALVAAVAGTAVAGPGATTGALTKSKVKKIAAQQVNALAPGLSVAHARSADTATNATAADSAAQADSATNALNADELDGLNSTQFQRSGASGSDTAGAGTVPVNENRSFPVAEGTFTYFCATTNAGWAWEGPGPPAEVWQDKGGGDPFHFVVTLGISGAIDTNDSDRYEYVFATANRVAFLDLYSLATGSECHFAYQLSEYQR